MHMDAWIQRYFEKEFFTGVEVTGSVTYMYIQRYMYLNVQK